MTIQFLLVFLLINLSNGIPLKLSSNVLKQDSSDDSPYSFAIDISSYASVSTLQCVYQQGYSTVFIQVYSDENDGNVNQDGIQTINAAKSANLGTEVYVTPNPDRSGASQFLEVYNALKDQRIFLRSIWLQVTSSSDWSDDISDNKMFIQSFVQQATSFNIKVGIYTNRDDWQEITGNDASDSNCLRLWYYNFYGSGSSGESPANFNDFQYFGAWSQPDVKQFAQNENLCGINVNRNVYVQNQKMAERETNSNKDKIVVGGFI